MGLRNNITNKIAKVCDCLCGLCAQNWQSECRAYQVAHSEEEFAARKVDTPLCEISVFCWSFGKPERHICEFETL